MVKMVARKVLKVLKVFKVAKDLKAAKTRPLSYKRFKSSSSITPVPFFSSVTLALCPCR